MVKTFTKTPGDNVIPLRSSKRADQVSERCIVPNTKRETFQRKWLWVYSTKELLVTMIRHLQEVGVDWGGDQGCGWVKKSVCNWIKEV